MAAVLLLGLALPAGAGAAISASKNGATVTAAKPGLADPVSTTKPAAPTNLTATATAALGGITLTWKDNSDNETGFTISRKEGSGDWTTPFASVSSNITNYLDKSAEAGKTYTYRVRASMQTGALSYTYSDYSNEASATIPIAVSLDPPIGGEIDTTVTITTQPKNKTVEAGGTASFNVAASGGLSRTYQWQRLSSVGRFGMWQDISDNDVYSGAKTDTLKLVNIPASYDGLQYRCVVTSVGKGTETIAVTLTVTGGDDAEPEEVEEEEELEEEEEEEEEEVLTVEKPTASPKGGTFDEEQTVTLKCETEDAIIYYTTNGSAPTASSTKYTSPIKISETTTLKAIATKEDMDDSEVMSEEYVIKEKPKGSIDNFAKANTYTSGQFSDVNEDQWYGFNKQKAIANAVIYGLMKGNSTTTFNPTGNMSVAEALTVAARVHSIYMTGEENFVQGPLWYQVYVEYAIENEIITGTAFTSYTRSVTRAEMAYIFANSMPMSEFAPQNTVNSLPDVSSATKYNDEIFLLYAAGILTGSDTLGTFNPTSNINRAEAAAIISRVILPDIRESGKTF